jgi:hypothetical protein
MRSYSLSVVLIERGTSSDQISRLGKDAHQCARTIGTNHRYLDLIEGRWPRGIVSKCIPVDISTSALLMDESSKHSTKTVRLRSGITYLPGSFSEEASRIEGPTRAWVSQKYNGVKRQLPAPLPLPGPMPLPMPLVVRRAPVLEPLDPPLVPWPPIGT